MAHVRTPLHLSAYALMISTICNGGLGFVFWVVAAHRYSPSNVGLNATSVSALALLTGISQLGLHLAVLRFVPQGGVHKAVLIARIYGACVAGAIVVGAAFLVGLPLWAPRLRVFYPKHAPSLYFRWRASDLVYFFYSGQRFDGSAWGSLGPA